MEGERYENEQMTFFFFFFFFFFPCRILKPQKLFRMYQNGNFYWKNREMGNFLTWPTLTAHLVTPLRVKNQPPPQVFANGPYKLSRNIKLGLQAKLIYRMNNGQRYQTET